MQNQIFQTNDKNPHFSLRGNGQFGHITRTGWVPCRLGAKKRAVIERHLMSADVDKVYSKNGKLYAMWLNGCEKAI